MNINIEAFWANADNTSRYWLLKNSGWNNRTSLSHARREWGNLSPAMQRVLLRKADEGVLGV